MALRHDEIDFRVRVFGLVQPIEQFRRRFEGWVLVEMLRDELLGQGAFIHE